MTAKDDEEVEQNIENFEEKIDELNDGLLEAYAAGFSKAVETFDVDPDFSTDVESLKNNGAVQEAHYYYWDGRVKPLVHWLKDEFEVSGE